MASATVCDLCGELIPGERRIVKIMGRANGSESRDARMIKNLDMHEECVDKFLKWFEDNKAKAVKA